jgi:peroxiredoxin
MKHYITLFTTLLALSAVAQKAPKKAVAQKPVQKANNRPSAYAVIKGHIANNTADLLDYSWNNYLGYNEASLRVDKNGDFIQKIKLPTEVTEVYLDVNDDDNIILALLDKDTITLTWDAKNFKKSLVIAANKPETAIDIKKCNDHRELFNSEKSKLYRETVYSKTPDSTKFRKINDLYNKEVQSLLTGEVDPRAAQLAIDTYYEYCKVLLSDKLLGKFELYLKQPVKKMDGMWPLTDVTAYKREFEEYFKRSSRYRDFIFDYIRFKQPFNAWGLREPTTTANSLPFSPAWDDYYSGLAAFHLIELRDWYITKSIMEDFSYYAFSDAVGVYKDFMPRVKTAYYADTLKAYYTNIQRLKPGSPAPQFTLKDENGKAVTLSSFKGKTVYIDFWGVNCGPCIYDITNNVPKLHEKYKDKNIVFINICVDADEKAWKETLKKLNLHGVNLLAQGWTKNPVVSTYNVTGIPHYYLLNNEGKIVNNNSERPGEEGLHAQLDKLLK